MVLLEKKDYHKAVNALRQVQINNLFARAVVELHVDGELYADNAENPVTFYVVHPYGMGLLFGDSDHVAFNAALANYVANRENIRQKDVLVQAWPDNWHRVWQQMFKKEEIQAKTEVFVRVNFRFEASLFQANKMHLNDSAVVLKETDIHLFEQMRGTVVPSSFWNNAQEFVQRGKGFSLVCGNEVVATAYSAFVIDNMLEIGIETVNGYRAKGYAREVCTALIDFALAQDLVPVWGCKRDNAASYELAQKLGFVPVLEIPYYRLKV